MTIQEAIKSQKPFRPKLSGNWWYEVRGLYVFAVDEPSSDPRKATKFTVHSLLSNEWEVKG